MSSFRYLLSAPFGLQAQVLGANLLASHYTGKIYSLSYGSNGSLAVTSSATGCGTLPAWLHLDSMAKTVYSVDEDWNGSGVLASYTVATDGSLKQSGSLAVKGASVHGTPYGGENGSSFFATVEYDPSTLTTYELPLKAGASVIQKLQFNMSAPGPNPRQNAPHPHAAQLDPTGKYLITPDLGADLIRIFSIDGATGNLTACEPAKTGPGDGPRHVAWWAPSGNSSTGHMMYNVNEIGNSVSSWSVAYPEGKCLTLTKKQTLPTYASNTTAPTGSKAAEVHVMGNYLYAANRADQTFGKHQDSMATYSINPATGEIAWVQATNAHAWFPRTFSINKAGDLVAIGGQTSSNVAVVKRDMTTGKLGDMVSSIQVATPGTEQQEDGLSAVIWVE
ncbi:putative isomerase YbhE [Xylariaceae sp. FL0016]|nr:putative isomerase YbhE [Xylariaceae sp. FL0016]